jgi:hypothetical protein
MYTLANMKSDYSTKELEMIKILSPEWHYKIKTNNDAFISPLDVLKFIALDCFINNKTGLAVESLRKCLKALEGYKIQRKTKEYNALICLNDVYDPKLDELIVQEEDLCFEDAVRWYGQG